MSSADQSAVFGAFSLIDVTTARVCIVSATNSSIGQSVTQSAPERVERLVVRCARGAPLTSAWRGHSELSKTNSECYAMPNAASLPRVQKKASYRDLSVSLICLAYS